MFNLVRFVCFCAEYRLPCSRIPSPDELGTARGVHVVIADQPHSFGDMTMTITSANKTQHFTEAEMQALSLRFEIRSELGSRRFFVDGVEVSEPAYTRAFKQAAPPLPLPWFHAWDSARALWRKGRIYF